ncbi:MAG: hypothetical protein ACI35S_06800 [Anaeroplasma sp.]
MIKSKQEIITELLLDVDKLMSKKPFTRGSNTWSGDGNYRTVDPNKQYKVELNTVDETELTQSDYLKELDPNSHKIIFDENIPSIHQKLSNGQYLEIKTCRTPFAIQKIIKNKQTMHLAANKMQFTLNDLNPSETNQNNFIVFKQYWEDRNQDGMKYKMVDTQKSVGDVGLLYYFNYNGEIKSRILKYPEYIICPHNDNNGDRLLDSVVYKDEYGILTIDNYDDTNMYRITFDGFNDKNEKTWRYHEPIKHGFKESPLVTKRGKVAWDSVQSLIESFEELYNVFIVVEKRWGWGILYVKGQFNNNAKKIAGSIVLQDSSLDGSGDAKFLTPPTPDGTINTLTEMLKAIQLCSSTTFILPQDVKTSGDISGIAIQLTQSLDIELASQEVIDWQNVADKMVRLFKYGLSIELVNKGINPNAITEFNNMHIKGNFKVWRPFSETEYNNMLISLKNAGLISEETGIETNTISKPDEKIRRTKEKENVLNNVSKNNVE